MRRWLLVIEILLELLILACTFWDAYSQLQIESSKQLLVCITLDICYYEIMLKQCDWAYIYLSQCAAIGTQAASLN